MVAVCLPRRLLPQRSAPLLCCPCRGQGCRRLPLSPPLAFLPTPPWPREGHPEPATVARGAPHNPISAPPLLIQHLHQHTSRGDCQTPGFPREKFYSLGGSRSAQSPNSKSYFIPPTNPPDSPPVKLDTCHPPHPPHPPYHTNQTTHASHRARTHVPWSLPRRRPSSARPWYPPSPSESILMGWGASAPSWSRRGVGITAWSPPRGAAGRNEVIQPPAFAGCVCPMFSPLPSWEGSFLFSHTQSAPPNLPQQVFPTLFLKCFEPRP